MSKHVETNVHSDIDETLSAFVKTALVSLNVKEASEAYSDPDENFDGWLPLTLASSRRYYDFTLQELSVVRDALRTVHATNEIAKNILTHYRNFVVGKGIAVTILPEDLGDDPLKLADNTKDATIAKMKENWKIFCVKNKFHQRCLNWVDRVHRDGEAFLRVVDDTDAPLLRFIDPYLITNSKDTTSGVLTEKDDVEAVTGYYYENKDTGTKGVIPVEEVIHDKRNVDIDAPRGIPTLWPCTTNLRRLEKILVNSSVLASVQAAITMVRQHKNATSAQVKAFLDKRAPDTRSDSVTGRSIRTQKVRPGTILDGSMDTEYQFPSHNVKADGFISIAQHELEHIAACVVLPVEWLLAREPTDPLTPGSPVVANFTTEQAVMYGHIEELFWRVQFKMGVSEDSRIKYRVHVNGPRLAVGKALDEARVDEILVRLGATSPQAISVKHGMNYTLERANTIAHRRTRQPGEVMPGDIGNTNPNLSGGDGLSTKDGTQRGADGDGGNNK